MTLFREPSTRTTGVAGHPPPGRRQRAVASTLAIAAGYEADVVSGATPATFGPHVASTPSAATKFSDMRQQVHGGFGYERPDGGISARGYAYGWESDYRSHVVSGDTHHDLLDHNFTLALAYTHNWDTVCDANNTAAAGQPLDLAAAHVVGRLLHEHARRTPRTRCSIDTFEPSLSWTMTPRLVVQGGATIQILDGFQSNPYRSVLVGSQNRTPQEHMPEFRQRYAVFARAVVRVPRAARLDARDGAPLRGQLGRARRHRRPRRRPSTSASRCCCIAARHYHLQSGASFYRNSDGYRDPGPGGPVLDRRPRAVADEQLPRWAASSRSCAARSRSARPGSSRWSSAASTRS